MDRATALLALCSAVMAVAAGGLTWIRWIRPKVRGFVKMTNAALVTLLGRDAITDPGSGIELSPEQPGLGVRIANLEDAVVEIARSHRRLDDHEVRITSLEQASVERTVTRAESIQHMRTTEAALYAQPPTLPQEDSDG